MCTPEVVSRLVSVVKCLLKILFLINCALLAVPLVFYTHPHALVYLITNSHEYLSKSVEPKDYNLNGRNFYLESSQGLLPVWHLYPKTFNSTEEAVDDLRRKDTPMLVYFHGKNRPRTLLNAYQGLLDDGFHLIVPELRGWLDSSGSFTGQAAVEEILHVHSWLMTQYVPGKHIVWWCYSLGTGICMQAAPKWKTHRPDGIILEAPFSSIRDQLMTDTSFRMVAGWHPFLTKALLNKVEKKYEMSFSTKENIVKLPNVHILHVQAKDDPTIKYDKHFGVIRDAVQKNRAAVYRPVTFEADRGFGHYPISENHNVTRQLVMAFWKKIVWNGSQRGNLTTTAGTTANITVSPTTTETSTVGTNS